MFLVRRLIAVSVQHGYRAVHEGRPMLGRLNRYAGVQLDHAAVRREPATGAAQFRAFIVRYVRTQVRHPASSR